MKLLREKAAKKHALSVCKTMDESVVYRLSGVPLKSVWYKSQQYVPVLQDTWFSEIDIDSYTNQDFRN